jgi:tape measure domain-containing protein
VADYELGLKIRVDSKTGKAEIVGVGDAVKRLGEEGRKSGQQINQGFSAARQGVQSISQQLAAARRDLIAFFLVGKGAQLFKEFVAITDAGKKMSGQLRQVTQDSAELAKVQKEIFKAAQDTRSGLEATTTLYARVARSTRDLNTTQQQNLAFTKAINQSFLLNGSTAEEAASGVIQLSQALQKGRLNGDEFVSVMEGAPLVVEALQKHLKASKEDLFKFAGEGKITSDVIVKAVLEMSGEWDRQFKLLPRTVEQALTQLRNAWIQGLRNVDTSALTRSIDEFRAILTDPQTLKAITGFAQAIVDSMGLAAKALQEFKGHGEEVLAIISALGGAKLGSRFGLPGALIGGGAGLLLSPRFEGRQAANADAEIEAINKQIEAKREALAKEERKIAAGDSFLAIERKRELTAEIEKLNEKKAALEAINREIKGSRAQDPASASNVTDTSNIKTLPVKPGKEKKPKASLVDDVRQEIEARLELQRGAARLELEEQQAGLEAGEQVLKRQLDANLISYRTYYTQLAELRQADIDAQIEAKRREIAIAEQAQANLPADKGKAAIEQARLQGDIERLMSEIGRLEAQKGEIVAEAQADIAMRDQDLSDQLDQFRLRLLELQNSDGVRLADIVIPPEQQTLFQARLTVLQNQYRAFIEQLKTAGNTEGVQIVERLINAEAVAQFKGRFSEMTEFGRQAAHNIQDAFANFLFDPFKGGLDGMLKGFVDTLRRMAAEAASQQILKTLFGGLKNLNLFGSGDFFGSMLASVKHSGGMAGAGGAARRVPALAFVGAPRLHSGGWIKPGEVPTILRTDEEVLTANDLRHRNNFRPGGNVEVHVHEAPGTRATVESRETEQGPRIDVLIEMVKGAVQSDIAKGGDVARTMEQRYRLNPAAGATR